MEKLVLIFLSDPNACIGDQAFDVVGPLVIV